MTNKEFEDKKQDIFKNLDKALGFLQNEDLYKCSNIIWDTMKDLKQLQPPKPPTCATCKHFSNYIDHKECECEKSANYCQEISDPQKYVCIKHSSYEVVE